MEKKTTTEIQYVIHVNYEYFERMCFQRVCNTAEERKKLFEEIVNGVRERLADRNSTDPLISYTFKDKDGKEFKAWYVEVTGKGNCIEAELEHAEGVPFKKFSINKDGGITAKNCVYIFTYIDCVTMNPLDVIVIVADNAEKAEQMAEREVSNRLWRNKEYRRISWLMDEYLSPANGIERMVYCTREAIDAASKK